MGFDPERIPIVRQAFRCRQYPLAEWDWREVRIVSNRLLWNELLPNIPDESTFHFEPHFGWKGQIERAISSGELIDEQFGSNISEAADSASARRL
jgi:hypothetical protein